MTSNIRQQVMAQIIDVMAAAEANGRRPIEAARAAFPGTPDIVLHEAETALEMREVEAWWQQIERTIDGEVIRRALSSSGKGEAA